jgi:hypothetical protein
MRGRGLFYIEPAGEEEAKKAAVPESGFTARLNAGFIKTAAAYAALALLGGISDGILKPRGESPRRNAFAGPRVIAGSAFKPAGRARRLEEGGSSNEGGAFEAGRQKAGSGEGHRLNSGYCHSTPIRTEGEEGLNAGGGAYRSGRRPAGFTRYGIAKDTAR